MNAIEILLWTTACWILVEIGRSGDDRLWVPLGLVLGLAFENKHTSLVLAAGIGVGMLLTPLRHHLRRPGPWLGVAGAVALALPNVVWQVEHDWVSLEFYGNLARESNLPVTPLDILGGQVIAMNPATAPVWIAGLVWLFSARGREQRALGWAFATALALLMASGASRPDRIAGLYPVAFAAGGVLLESASRLR